MQSKWEDSEQEMDPSALNSQEMPKSWTDLNMPEGALQIKSDKPSTWLSKPVLGNSEYWKPEWPGKVAEMTEVYKESGCRRVSFWNGKCPGKEHFHGCWLQDL